MPQLLHLLIVDREGHRGLVQHLGDRWVLPIAACRDRARAPAIVSPWLSARAIDGDVVGQWRGRLSVDARACDWLVIVRTPAGQMAPHPLTWTPLAELRAAPAIVDYQSSALNGSDADALAAPGPFGRLSWLDDVARWATGRTGSPVAGRLVCYRASSYEVVAGLDVGPGRCFFKGVSADSTADAIAMHAASCVAPESFARSIAFESMADGAIWWLMRACPGRALATAMSRDAAVRVAADVGRLQRRLAESGAARALEALDLHSVLGRVSALLPAFEATSAAASARSAIVDAFDAVSRLPISWTPLDLDPVNVFMHGSRIRYIDLEPRLAPMPLSISIFARRIRRRRDVAAGGDPAASLRHAYERALGASFPWKQVDIVAAAVEAVLDLERLGRNMARGELSGPSSAFRDDAARRLAAAVRPSIDAVQVRT
jgi:hypothetical protein